MMEKQLPCRPVELTRLFLEQLQALGIHTVYLEPQVLAKTILSSDLKVNRRQTPKPRVRVSASDTPNQSQLDQIAASITNCTLCKLCRNRTQVVFGVGNPNAELVFVGEAPGFDEDQQGIPFVGKAGQLLTKMIAAMGLPRDEVYICNVVKCRPPGNRNPELDEIALCEPFLFKQLEIIHPRVLVALGKFAAQTLLNTTEPISRLRGRWFEYRGIRLMPTFHPSYLLRSPEEKHKAWEDLQKVMAELGLSKT